MAKVPIRVLVVDDELPICDLLEEFLSILGYQVTVAISGEDATEKFREIRPDLVLMDIRMPGMSGLEALGKIKEMDSNTDVIMLSAFGDLNTIQQALNMGATYYMEKPIVFDRLADLLSLWREGSGSGDANDIP